MAETQTTIVYNKIKKKIENGDYSPAQSLPEAALAKEYNVSRNTVKKALLMLENDAYVSMDLNKGAKVRSYSKNEVLQYLELREVLEGFIIKKTVPAITASNIARLKSILDKMTVYKNNNELLNYSKCNQEFHNIIYASCPNQTAVDTTIKLKNQMRKYNSKTILIHGRSEQSLTEHTEIYNAIHDRDVEKADEYMQAHIRNVRHTFEQYYEFLF